MEKGGDIPGDREGQKRTLLTGDSGTISTKQRSDPIRELLGNDAFIEAIVSFLKDKEVGVVN